MSITRKNLRRTGEFFSHLDFNDFSTPESNLRIRARESGLTFFGSARISHNPELLRFGLFKRILTGLKTGDKVVDNLYRQWSSAKPKESMQAGIENEMLKGPEVEELIIERDPALIVISSLEKLRIDEYPEISIEKTADPKATDRLTEIYQSYEHLLSSIHGHRA